MPNILLGRIDNRLVHGQVGVTWTKTIGCNLIVVVDDEVATDKLQQDLMAITADTAGGPDPFLLDPKDHRRHPQSRRCSEDLYRYEDPRGDAETHRRERPHHKSERGQHAFHPRQASTDQKGLRRRQRHGVFAQNEIFRGRSLCTGHPGR